MTRAKLVNICGSGLFAATFVLQQVTFDVPAARGQSGIILPNLADNPNMLPDTNSDLTETAGTDTPSATASIGFDLAGNPITPMPGGAGGIENVTNLVNNITAGDPADNTAKWLDFQGDDMMMPVHIELASAAAVNYYALTSANDAPDRDPWRWRVLGTNVAAPTMVSDFTVLESREGVIFSARDQTQLFSFANTTPYKIYRFEFETHEVAVPGFPTGGGYDSIQLAEVEFFNGFAFSGPVLEINRDTGAMTLTNGSSSPLNVTGYSITSAQGTLNSNPGTWLSMYNNYDGNSGGLHDTDNWIRLTETNGRRDLSEVENPNGTNGAVLDPAEAINLGNAWIKYPIEDVLGEILLANGTTQTLTVSFTGGAPYAYGDLNFSRGPLTFQDWIAFKNGQDDNFASFHSAAESYSHGDLDGDFDHDLDDFGIFKATYDTALGAGAFAEMLASIPEPGSAALLACLVLVVGLVRTPRRWAGSLVLLACATVLLGNEATQAGEVLTGLRGAAGAPDGLPDLTNPDNLGAPDVVITAGDAANSPLTELPPNALDNGTATKWLAFQPNGTFYQMQFNGGAQHALNTYTLTSGNDAPERDPYRWNLSGSNDGSNFTVIDQQSGNVFTARGQTQQFVVANTQVYNYYRFDFLTKLGAGGFNPGAPNSIQLAEIELFDDPDPDIMTLVVDPAVGTLSIANNSSDAIPFEAYQIRSAAGSLNRNVWWGAGSQAAKNGGESIHDTVFGPGGPPAGNGTGNGWEEGPGSTDFELVEYNLGSTTGACCTLLTTFNSGDAHQMDNVFRVGMPQDLIFEYRSQGQNVRGFVEYIGLQLPGDHNGDGVVNAADYVEWRKTDSGNPQGYIDFVRNFGETSPGSGGGAAGVPEPASFVLALLAPGILLTARRRVATRTISRGKAIQCLPLDPLSNARANKMKDCRKYVCLPSVMMVCFILAGTALGSTTDRDYQFQGNGIDGAAPADNLTENGGPTYVNVQALGRPGATVGELGVQLTGASSQYLDGFGLGSPPEGAPIGVAYPESRLMQVWVRPTLDTGARQDVVSDTFQFGIFIADNDTWGHTYGSDNGDDNTPDDYATTAPVTYNAWTHIMQRTFENDGVAVYVNGVAVSRFQADYEVATLPITPSVTPAQLDIYVGALGTAPAGGTSNFFTGQLDDLKLSVAGAVTGGSDFGAVNLATENDYIADYLADEGFIDGDVNGDGVVNGTGTGPVATDDVSFFIAHWLDERRVNNILVGDLTSRTTMADLNFDGRTSLADWNILRGGHAGAGGLDLGALLSGVPEPSTFLLAGVALLSMGGFFRRVR